MCMHISWHSIDTLLTHRNIIYGSGLLHRESVLVTYGAPQHQLSSCTGGTENEEWGMEVYSLIAKTIFMQFAGFIIPLGSLSLNACRKFVKSQVL